MIVIAKTKEVIDQSLAVLRWQNRVAAVLLCAFGLFLTGMIFGISQSLIPYCGAGGFILGLLAAHWHWRRWLNRLSSCFLKAEGEYLEVRGMVGGGLAHMRFRISNIVAFEFGRRRTSLVHALPILRTFDSAALIVGEANGGAIALELAGVIFDRQQLERLRESFTVAQKL